MELNDSPIQHKPANQSINYWKIIRILLSRWYWIAGTIIIGFVLAKLYIRSTPPIYNTSATLKLDNGEQGQFATPSAPLNRYYRPNQIQSEGLIIKSEDVILRALKKLNYKVSFYLEGRLRTSEVYPNIPFTVQIIKQDTANINSTEYLVRRKNNRSFQLSNISQPEIWSTYNYGQVIDLGNTLFRITSLIPQSGKYSFKFNDNYSLFNRAVNGLSVDEAEKNTNIMQVSHTDNNAQFSADLLNAIVTQYIENDAEQKKRSAIQTINYLDEQINFIDSAVNKSGDKLSGFQTKNSVIDPLTDKQINTSKLSEFQQQIAGLELQEINIKLLESQLKSNVEKIQLNLDLEGTGSTLLTGLILQYNELVNDRVTSRKEFKEGSKPILEIDSRLGTVRQAITTNVRLLHERNQKTIKFLNGELAAINRSLNTIPAKQNDFTKLQNKLDINQKMYSLLFERKLSAQITKAAVIPGATIISLAQPAGSPVYPIERQVYISYILMGFLAGVGLIMLLRIINPYIYDAETVEGLTSTPIIGVILKYPEKVNNDFRRILSLEKPKSVFAESVRSVRTNLSFMASQKANKVICVTSEISGEGKSFVTVNLAGTLAIIDKKVIVIAADLRRSKLHKTFGSDNKKGLSTYLSSKHSVAEIIGHDEENSIDYITSGPVPPNPSELLYSNRMLELIEILKETYDYVLIDTAPVGLVSDSVPLIRNADINLFIIRSGVSKFRAASIPDRLAKEYNLKNIAIILNSFGDEKLHSNIYSTNYAHGNAGSYYYSDYTGYGNYGYYEDGVRKKWWQFWKK